MAIKWLNVIAFIVLCGFLVVIGFTAYIAYMNRLDVLSSISQNLTTRIPALNNLPGTINTTIQGITETVKANPLITPILGIAGTTSMGLLVNWWKNRKIQQEQKLQAQLTTQMQDLSQTVLQKQATIDSLNKQLATPDLSALSEAQRLVTTQADQLRQQTTEIQRLITERNTLAQMVETMKLKTYETTVVK